MNFVCSKEKLASGLQVVQRAVSPKNPLPILSGIKFTTGEDCVILTATDLELGIRCTVPAEITGGGSIVLPSRYITELIRRLPDLPVYFYSDRFATGAVIKYAQSETIINGFPVDEFPDVSFTMESVDLSLPAATFKDAVRKVVFAASQDENRPVYTGIMLEIQNNKLNLVATDTHRLACFTMDIEGDPVADINLIIPGKTLNELVKVIADSETVEISFPRNQVLFSAGKISFISRLIDARFPNYRQVIPASFISRIRINTRDLLDATDRASLLAMDKSPIVKLDIGREVLSVRVATEAGRVNEEVPVQFAGDPLQVAFNARYLSDALKAVGTGEAELDFTGPLSPSIIRPAGTDNYFSLILPVRVKEE
ncbi:MAG: DNA polymerase III subunit beta [Firmicutes bacterium]|nr:DNA polymerase III subunit beta [Bacillota bacterium]